MGKSLKNYSTTHKSSWNSLLLPSQLPAAMLPQPLMLMLNFSSEVMLSATLMVSSELTLLLLQLPLLLLPQLLPKLRLLLLPQLSLLLPPLPTPLLPQLLLLSTVPQLLLSMLPQLPLPLLQLFTMLATRFTTRFSMFPKSPSRSMCPTTPPSTSSTMPQLLEPTLDSQLLPQLLLLRHQNKSCLIHANYRPSHT